MLRVGRIFTAVSSGFFFLVVVVGWAAGISSPQGVHSAADTAVTLTETGKLCNGHRLVEIKTTTND